MIEENKSMIPVSSAHIIDGLRMRNKKHQGKISLVCVYVSPLAFTVFSGDVACDADETESMFLYIILTRPG